MATTVSSWKSPAMTIPPAQSPYEPQDPQQPWQPPSADGAPTQGSSAYGTPSYGSPSHGSPSAGAAPAAGAPLPDGAPGPVGPAPGTDLGTDLGAGLSFAWAALTRNLAPFLVAGAVYSVLYALLIGGGVVLGIALAIPHFENAKWDETAELTAMAYIYGFSLLGGLLVLPFSLMWQSGTMRAGRRIVEGDRPTIGQALLGSGRVILTGLLVVVITFVGMLLCYVPGLIASVLLAFALPAAARGASPIEACKESVALVRKNLGTTIVAMLVASAIASIAGMLVITLVVIIPFMSLFLMGIYERLSGRALVDPAHA